MPFEPRIIRAEEYGDRRQGESPGGPLFDEASAGEFDHGAAAEAELPDDLRLLAEQLSDDASFLASRYPSGEAEGERFDPSGREAATPAAANRTSDAAPQTKTMRAAALTSALALGGVSFALLNGSNPPALDRPMAVEHGGVEYEAAPVEESPAETVAPESASSARRGAARSLGETHNVNAGREIASADSTKPTAEQIAHLRNLSAPELEGVIDLQAGGELEF